MPGILKGILTVVVATGLGLLSGFLLNLATGEELETEAAILIGAIFGLLYGLETGILLSYNLGSPKGWGQLLLDFTWSFPNTVFGFVFGNLIYIFFGNPSRAESRDEGWVVFKPRTTTQTFGNDVLQTLGTINLGGRGNHEYVHLIQARILGPLFLPIAGVNYVINFLIQVLWTGTIGLILWLVRVRTKPYFRPPSNSAVQGFWGWIYFATLFELWAYGTEP